MKLTAAAVRMTFLVFSLSFALNDLSFASPIRVGPSDSWCTSINSAVPGDEVILAPGIYTAPCRITAKGEAGSPIVIRSESDEPSDGSTFAYSGSTSNVIEMRSTEFLFFRGFHFSDTQAGVDAIRIRKASNITIENNTFQGIGGVSIAANSNNTDHIVIRGNTFRDLRSTCLYFGCHDGASECTASDILVENNLIDTVATPFNTRSIGYGLEIKLNSYGTVRYNTIYRTKGPGIMVYGSDRGAPANVVEGNYVEGSLKEGGIVIGGGPAKVVNNVLVGNAFGGISAQNYSGRNLQQNIWIVHNTILNNGDSGINVPSWRLGSGNVVAYNAILTRSGTPPLRPHSPSGIVKGNIRCDASCFVNAVAPPYDLRPSPSSPLLNAAGGGTEPWRTVVDFMGVPRGTAAGVGAFERSGQLIDHLVGGGTRRPAGGYK